MFTKKNEKNNNKKIYSHALAFVPTESDDESMAKERAK